MKLILNSKTIVACISLFLVLTVSGCGDKTNMSEKESNNSAQVYNAPSESSYTKDDVIEVLGLLTEDNIGYETKSGCQIAVIMTDSSQVQAYASASDTVIANPSGAVGVKVVGASEDCVREISSGLSTLK